VIDQTTLLAASPGTMDDMPTDKRLCVRVPSMVGNRLWRMVVTDLAEDKFVKVSGGPFGRACGHDRWVDIDTIKPADPVFDSLGDLKKKDVEK